jgi:hypothetical protein
MGGGSIEGETRGEGPPQFSQSLDRFFTGAIAGNLELPWAGYPHFDLVAFL